MQSSAKSPCPGILLPEKLWIAPMEDIKKKRLMDAVDQITDTYGRHTITLGKAFTKDGWQMKREFLSPRVTTDINCIPVVD